ncbi:MAG: zinc metalloprotease HtpX [Alphaproteobacteria bacterium]|nr:zinc metalloprotease HtpX [Alphaproteobacteria bacterium]
MIATTALVAAMAAVLALTAWVIGGWSAVLWVGAALVAALLIMPKIPAAFVMRLLGARPIRPYEAPELAEMMRVLADRAGWPAPPQLYRLADPRPNAITIGAGGQGAIAVSDGLLRQMPPRELFGILGHEMSHLVSGDAELMRLCGLIAEATRLIGFYGLIVCLFLALGSDVEVPLTLILLFGLAPTAVVLLQLALARRREFAADEGGARLTGDPRGLARALARIEAARGTLWWRWPYRILTLPQRDPAPWLSTHPDSRARIERLARMADQASWPTREQMV